MIIRRLSLQDIPQAAQIHAASFDEGWTEDSLKSHIETDICLGGGSPNLIGFSIVRPAGDQAEIITIAVDPIHRGQGIGAQLTRANFNLLKAEGVEVLFLEVAEDNLPAIKLYEKCGFAPIGKRPAYYRRAGGRIAALTLRKDL